MRLFVTLTVASAFVVATIAPAQTQRRSRTGEVAGPRDEMICRRFVRTGSLADFYRICKTRGEWDRERQNLRSLSNGSPCLVEGGAVTTGSVYGGQVNCGI
jgi:hypothetical protein